MQFIDLAAQQKKVRQDLERRIIAVLDHGKYIMGPEVDALETVLGRFVDTRHAIGCASGTDALLMALMAHGLGPGDAVFTTPFTFIATAEVIRLLGATPVFVDIDPVTFNMDPILLKSAILAVKSNDPSVHPLPSTKQGPLVAKGIIAVDLFGLPADYAAITEIAAENDLFVIEDGAQSFGAEYNGRKAGALAAVGCTSFFPAKPLGCYGDGGMCFTDDDGLAEVMRSIRIHGKGGYKYDNVRIGINGRLDTIQAAILLSKMTLFPDEVRLRQVVAERYSSLLSGLRGLTTPTVPDGSLSVWAQYSVLAEDGNARDRLQNVLKEKGIPTAVYYPKPLHLQTAFADLGYHNGDFPISEDCSQRVFSLPMHPYLEGPQQEKIASVLSDTL